MESERFHASEAGQTMAEYATMLGVLIVAAVAAVAILGPVIEAAIEEAATRI